MTKTNDKAEPVTFDLVKRREQQRVQVQKRIDSLTAEEAEPNAVIRASHREDQPGDAAEARQRRNECREDLADLQAALRELDAEIPGLPEEAGEEEARKRLVGHCARIRQYPARDGRGRSQTARGRASLPRGHRPDQ